MTTTKSIDVKQIEKLERIKKETPILINLSTTKMEHKNLRYNFSFNNLIIDFTKNKLLFFEKEEHKIIINPIHIVQIVFIKEMEN